MGDVAMVASVLREFQDQHTDTEIIMVSRPLFSAFFDGIPRLKFHQFDPKYKHRGMSGLVKLFKELKPYGAKHVADLHNNLRSRFLDLLFRTTGYQVKILDKGRPEKKSINKATEQSIQTTQTYYRAIRRCIQSLGISCKS
jgi:ADP-heptose:LPS heptosyltransferase